MCICAGFRRELHGIVNGRSESRHYPELMIYDSLNSESESESR